ncbi:hypothetical protein BMS3Abin03_00259 [bacterium BMS3Abin03]|nr:hypothetical protein BMS3Abin03_00259 [bacterium BMS3Abin03]
MELIDVIKSSIILFIVITAVVVFFSFGLYKIRNQAKRTKSSTIAQNNINVVENNPSGTVQNSESNGQKTLTTDKLKVKTNERFKVVNNNSDDNTGRSNWRSNNYHINVFKFYENTVSSEMFKIKVEDRITS